MPAVTAGLGSSTEYGSSTDVEMTDGFPGSSSNGSTKKLKGRLHRAAYGVLPSLPARTGNVDVSPSGTIAVATKSAVYILNYAIDSALSDKPGFILKSHYDPEREIAMHQARIASADVDKEAAAAGQLYTGMPGYTDYLKAEDAVIQAKWAPVEIGPLRSPVIAVLTAKRNLALYIAKDNFVTGRWTQELVLNHCTQDSDVVTEPLTSFTWLTHPDDDRKAYLAAASLHGTIYLWQIAPIKSSSNSLEAELVYEKSMFDTCIYGIFSSRSSEAVHTLAASVRGRICFFQLQDDRSGHPILVQNGKDVAIYGHINMAACHEEAWLFCTPGRLYLLENHDNAQQVHMHLLTPSQKSPEAKTYQPASSASWSQTEGCFVVTLQDGTYYRAIATTSQDDQFVREIGPCGYIEAPNDEIAKEQRQVERLRGLSDLKEGGPALVYMCHDANDISSWTYLRRSKSSFSFALQFGEKETEKGLVMRLLDDLLKMDGSDDDEVLINELNRLRHSIIVLVEQSDRRERLLDQLAHVLRSHCEDTSLGPSLLCTAAALQVCLWLQQRQSAKNDRAESSARITSLQPLSDLRMRYSLMKLAADTLTDPARVKDLYAAVQKDYKAAVTQIKVLMVAARALDSAVSDGPYSEEGKNAAKTVQELAEALIGSARTSQIVTSQRNASNRGSGHEFETGEECRVCRSAILFDDRDLGKATCSGAGKHEWIRCATTFAIMTKPRAFKCILCARETVQPSDAQNVLQRFLLTGDVKGEAAPDALERCGVCCGAWVSLT